MGHVPAAALLTHMSASRHPHSYSLTPGAHMKEPARTVRSKAHHPFASAGHIEFQLLRHAITCGPLLELKFTDSINLIYQRLSGRGTTGSWKYTTPSARPANRSVPHIPTDFCIVYSVVVQYPWRAHLPCHPVAQVYLQQDISHLLDRNTYNSAYLD